MIKYLIFSMMALVTPNLGAQNLSFEETVDYLNTKIMDEYIAYERIKASNTGNVNVELSSNVNFTYVTSFKMNLKKVDIRDVEQSGPREIGAWNVRLKCKTLGCVVMQYYGESSVERNDGYSFYFNDKENAIKFRKALIYLRKKMISFKDPFD